MTSPRPDRQAAPDTRALTCPKCDADMELGFMVDNSHGAIAEPEWASGPVQRSWWTGVKVSDRRKHVVQTYRCTACGFLESYAPNS